MAVSQQGSFTPPQGSSGYVGVGTSGGAPYHNTVPFTTDATTIATDASAHGVGATAPAASTGRSNPEAAMYATYKSAGEPMSLDASALGTSLGQTVFDPHGPQARPAGGRMYNGAWVNPYSPDYARNPIYNAPIDGGGEVFKYNQQLMTIAQNFDPFIQRKVMETPHWWVTRIPRGAYPLFSGTVQETRIFRGGLGHYAGLAEWEDLAPDPTKADPCAPMPFKTYQYAWETLAWSGKKTAWGSDPICIDLLKFTREATQQLGWILDAGVKFGIDIQNVWNRDMFIYYSVLAGNSYVMTSSYRGTTSPRYFYNPYVKFDAAPGAGSAGHADKQYVTKPFIVFDASADIEPLNFDVLEIVRMQLKRRCPEAAVGTVGSEKMFAIAVAAEDVFKYIRGNEELRRYWIEADPQTLIKGYGFNPTTFRRWAITDDDNQLRFKIKAYYPAADWTNAAANRYGGVGKELVGKGKPVYIAEYVEPEIGGRPGINGAPVPEPNIEYDFAELAIAPIFMNNVFTNLFVPDLTSIAPGSGTWFGAKKGLNGKWGWYNIQTPENPDNKIGNFKGEFHIVPKPETCVYDAISFLYRRCAEPLPSVCPADNYRVNVTKTSGSPGSATVGANGRTGTFAVKLAGYKPAVGSEVLLYTDAAGTEGETAALVFGTTAEGVKFQITGTAPESQTTYLFMKDKAAV